MTRFFLMKETTGIRISLLTINEDGISSNQTIPMEQQLKHSQPDYSKKIKHKEVVWARD